MTMYLRTCVNWPSTRESAFKSLEANGFVFVDATTLSHPKKGIVVVSGSDDFITINYLEDKPVQHGQVPYTG